MNEMFGKKKAEPIRKDRVTRIVAAGMKETDAADRSTKSAAFKDAKTAFEATHASATRAEIAAAHRAMRRHGY